MVIDKDTYCVYRLVCFPTCKIYVGKAKNLKHRKRHHFYHLRQQMHVNEYLQRAYDKYGEQSFYFEVLESNISPDDIVSRECYWIAHFDSYKNGFNLTTGGEGRSGFGRECVWNSIEYPTVTAAATAMGISFSSMRERVDKGYTCDSDMPGSESSASVACVWNGIHYSSIAKAAKDTEMESFTLRNWIKRGYTSDIALPKRGKKCEWNGVFYETVREAAKANDIREETMHYRVNKGYKCDADLRCTFAKPPAAPSPASEGGG